VCLGRFPTIRRHFDCRFVDDGNWKMMCYYSTPGQHKSNIHVIQSVMHATSIIFDITTKQEIR
jgi:hypothetical protein